TIASEFPGRLGGPKATGGLAHATGPKIPCCGPLARLVGNADEEALDDRLQTLGGDRLDHHGIEDGVIVRGARTMRRGAEDDHVWKLLCSLAPAFGERGQKMLPFLFVGSGI